MTDTTAAPSLSHNSAVRYGTVTKTFHWLTALLIFVAFPLGVLAERWPVEPDTALAFKAQLFSIHKTVGVSVFFVALLRIVWAMTQAKPVPLHPDRTWETLAAETVHWALYASLVVVPLSGWVHHAASSGFAPILWPLGQGLPLVPQSETWYAASGAVHWVFTKVLLLSIILHVAGAVKHVVRDRDDTLARMWFGRTTAGDATAEPPHTSAALIAAGIFAVGFLAAFFMTSAPEETATAATLEQPVTGNWTVESGTLGFTVQQFGNAVEGSFSDWTADITFSEEPADGTHGRVEVTIAIGSVTVGSVTREALAPEYFAAETHPTATFAGDILPGPDAGAYVADGTLTLKGSEEPLALPFMLEIDGDTATMSGTVTVERLSWDIGGQSDTPVGPEVTIDAELTASRADESTD